jgi:hypothetical protein
MGQADLNSDFVQGSKKWLSPQDDAPSECRFPMVIRNDILRQIVIFNCICIYHIYGEPPVINLGE